MMVHQLLPRRDGIPIAVIPGTERIGKFHQMLGSFGTIAVMRRGWRVHSGQQHGQDAPKLKNSPTHAGSPSKFGGSLQTPAGGV